MSRAPVVAALIATALLTASGVRAAEDGGLLSPFATGAGCRPLALGGAFVAIAEDATAITWNPAGLARTTRSGFEATHADQGTLGARDESGAIVVPSWRWGAAALAIRHFGVDGIERRDDRNLLLDGGTSDSETEIALGFARPMGEAWSLGGALKFQRQSLAGFSSGAVGADLGVLVSLGPLLPRYGWLEGVTTGVAIRNAVEPSLRLDRENVADPRLWRLGLGWQGSVAGGREVRAAFDVDRSSVTAMRVHAGAELRLHPLMALRLGIDQGHATAGAGFRWREFDVSYAFQDIAVGPVHRVGLSRAFGPTVSASRDAARLAEQQALQERLDDEFTRRRAGQLGDLLARAGEAIDQGAFDRAFELLGAAGTLDSTDARVRMLEARGERLLGASLEKDGDYAGAAVAFGRALAIAPDDSLSRVAEARCRAASETRAARDAGRKARFDQALNAFVAGDLGAARSAFARLVADDPSDSEARGLLKRVDQAVAQRVDELLRQARASADANATDEAARLLARVRALDPNASGIADIEARIAGLRRPAPVPVSTTPGTVSAAARREADDLFRRGVASMSAGRPDDALKFWELALSLDPTHPSAARYLNREYLVRGMDAYAAGKLDEAMTYWEKAQRADPSDRRAAGFLARARERVERTREIGAQPR